MDSWWLFFAVGFGAQLVDGTLGMAYGVLSNTALMAIGLPPAHASALVHTAEIFTTSASAASHIYHRNVDWRLVARLGITGVLGAILGHGFCQTSKSHPRGVSSTPTCSSWVSSFYGSRCASRWRRASPPDGWPCSDLPEDFLMPVVEAGGDQ